ncbi:MAG: hypothetical protein AAF636_14365 [Pseudomonadota bacterium]
MESVFSKELQAGLDVARKITARKKTRLRVRVDGTAHPVLTLRKSGFAVADDVPALRGRVDLYDGERHLFQCLIVTSADEAGSRHYEFKRATAITDRAARDFALPDHAPVALITGKLS